MELWSRKLMIELKARKLMAAMLLELRSRKIMVELKARKLIGGAVGALVKEAHD